MSDRVHPSVLRELKNYRSNLVVLPRSKFNPWEGEEEYIWFVCQPVLTAEPIVHGLWSARFRPHPVLSMTRRQANQWDRRVLERLDGGRFVNQKDAYEEFLDDRRRVNRDLDNECEAFAKDYYRQWLRDIDEFSFAKYSAKDPTRERKTLEDKLGREFGMI